MATTATPTHRVGPAMAAIAFVLTTSVLSACSTDDSAEPPPEATTSPVGTEPSTSVPQSSTSVAEPSGEAVTETPIRIVIGDETLDATLFDNPAARSLLDQLPLTLDFQDYGGQEVLARPTQPLTMEGMPAGESTPTGTIGYFQSGGVVTLSYIDVGRFNGLVRLGSIEGDVSILAGWDAPRSVTIERTD